MRRLSSYRYRYPYGYRRVLDVYLLCMTALLVLLVLVSSVKSFADRTTRRTAAALEDRFAGQVHREGCDAVTRRLVQTLLRSDRPYLDSTQKSAYRALRHAFENALSERLFGDRPDHDLSAGINAICIQEYTAALALYDGPVWQSIDFSHAGSIPDLLEDFDLNGMQSAALLKSPGEGLEEVAGLPLCSQPLFRCRERLVGDHLVFLTPRTLHLHAHRSERKGTAHLDESYEISFQWWEEGWGIKDGRRIPGWGEDRGGAEVVYGRGGG